VVVLAAVFFISGADAGAIVLGTFSSRGNPDPKKWLVVTWGVLIGLVALVLLMVGGLDALQWGAIVVASPFVLMLLAMCVGFVIDLRSDTKAGVPARPA
jgi:glycine betaine transporter